MIQKILVGKYSAAGEKWKIAGKINDPPNSGRKKSVQNHALN
jgi:hypothetical protein